MSLEPPPFQESSRCDVCKCSFNTFRRRHHCRCCGRTLCAEHSSDEMALPQFGLHSPVRVCSDCYNNASRSNRQTGWKLVMDAKKRRQIYEGLGTFARKCIFSILSVSKIPNHIAFIMDGNRRYSKQHNLIHGEGHRVGFTSLMSMLAYCYELGVKYVTIYAFSIENFKRSPEEVQSLMDLMEEKIKGLIQQESIVNQYGVRVYFIGNLKLLSKPVRLAAERAMDATAKNSRAVLSICIAYTSTDEILHAVVESCEEKRDNKGEKNLIGVTDIERHMYMRVTPDPDIIIRTSGETRLSNFLLWQSGNCVLYSPAVLWPEIGFRHLVQAVLEFQKHLCYLNNQKKILSSID